ncbi:unnamed protein product [Prunus brigantina]
MRLAGTVPKLGAEGSHSSGLVHVSGAYWLFILLMEGVNFVEVGRSRWRRQRVASSRWVKRRFDFRASRASSVEAISDESFRYQKRFPTCANGKPSDFRCCERWIRRFPSR